MPADDNAPPALILASASPRRRELLVRVGISLEIRAADIDESTRDGEGPMAYVRRVALEKAETIASGAADRWVLAADTIVVRDDVILGKPATPADARLMLASLVGRDHQVTTAFALVGPGGADQTTVSAVTTTVTMRAASEAEIDDYVASGEWRGKAGGYAIQGIAGALIRRIDGSVTNVIGLPLAEVLEALAQTGAARVDLRRGVPA